MSVNEGVSPSPPHMGWCHGVGAGVGTLFCGPHKKSVLVCPLNRYGSPGFIIPLET